MSMTPEQRKEANQIYVFTKSALVEFFEKNEVQFLITITDGFREKIMVYDGPTRAKEDPLFVGFKNTFNDVDFALLIEPQSLTTHPRPIQVFVYLVDNKLELYILYSLKNGDTYTTKVPLEEPEWDIVSHAINLIVIMNEDELSI